MINLLETPILKALLDESIPFHEVMNAFDIKTSIAFNLSQSVYGFVAYFGDIRTLIPGVSGQHIGNIWTPCRANKLSATLKV